MEQNQRYPTIKKLKYEKKNQNVKGDRHDEELKKRRENY